MNACNHHYDIDEHGPGCLWEPIVTEARAAPARVIYDLPLWRRGVARLRLLSTRHRNCCYSPVSTMNAQPLILPNVDAPGTKRRLRASFAFAKTALKWEQVSISTGCRRLTFALGPRWNPISWPQSLSLDFHASSFRRIGFRTNRRPCATAGGHRETSC